MIKKLEKHELNFEKTLEYVRYNLSGGKTLSSQILKIVDFSKGHFFTLLPHDANAEKIYDFQEGYILPQNPEEEYFIDGKRCTYSLIPTLREELTYFLLTKVKLDANLSCVFEEVLTLPKSPHLDFFRKNKLLFIFSDQNEVYYLIKNQNAKGAFISKCIQKSNAIWHLLCVVTKSQCPNTDNGNISLEDLVDICRNIELIIIGAYDGEGYVFWERST